MHPDAKRLFDLIDISRLNHGSRKEILFQGARVAAEQQGVWSSFDGVEKNCLKLAALSCGRLAAFPVVLPLRS